MSGPLSVSLKPTHFGLFALDRITTEPITRLPVYAEVAWVQLDPPAPHERRFEDAVYGALNATDEACAGSQSCSLQVRTALHGAVVGVLTQSSRDRLAEDYERALAALTDILRHALDAAGTNTFKDFPETQLPGLIEDAARAVAEQIGLSTELPPEERPREVAIYPLGLLATDHVGYLSFDLTRLPQGVFDSLTATMEAQRAGRALAAPTASVWVYPFGSGGRFDALGQRRFAHDALVMRLEIDRPAIPEALANLGILSMQNPGLTDWRLSPASFATNPAALLGEAGCETILPANLALHEFNFHQVIGVSDPKAQPELAESAKGKVKVGFVNEYRMTWYPVGHSLGQILYSFPLAPGESVNLAVIDWTRRDSALRDETTKFDESLTHELRRDRIVSETMKASIEEWQRGSSFMGGMASSAGGAAGYSGIGLAAGISNALGGSTATTRGSRDIAADTMQKLSDNVAQASAASRELNSTVVVQTAQAESQAIETRTIVNYNHSHALTILYYEVLRHYRLVSQFVRRRPVVLTNVHRGLIRMTLTPKSAVVEVDRTVLVENRKVIEAALLDERYKGHFDLLEKARHQERVKKIVGEPEPPPNPPPPQGPWFRYIRFEMVTGGMAADPEDDDDEIQVKAVLNLRDPGEQLHLNDGHHMNAPGTFSQVNQNNAFDGLMPQSTHTVPWGRIESVAIHFHLIDVDDLSFQSIKIMGVDVDGNRTLLVEENYAAGGGHLTLKSDSWITLSVKRPTPPPPPPARPLEEIEEEAKIGAFLDHIYHHRAHYERALRLGANPWQRAAELNAVETGTGPLSEKVENRPLDLVGDFVAYPCIDPAWSKRLMDAYAELKEPDPSAIERLVTLPTRGVFAEAKLGHCNASEEIDNTRFWDWQQSPIPHMAPEIAPTQPVTPENAPPAGLEPTGMPASLLNIVNPPAAPDPQGMLAAMTALTAANVFRDMSGRAEVSDLLKKLTDASVQIASVAQKAAIPVSPPSSGSGGSSTGGTTQPPAQQTPPASTPPTQAQAEPANRPPTQTAEQRESAHISNQQQKLDTAKSLPPPQAKEVRKAVTKELTSPSRPWRINLTSEWSGETIKQPMDAIYSGQAYFDNLPADSGGVYLEDRFTSSVASWDVKQAGNPTHLYVYVREIRPVSALLTVKVPGLTVEDLTLQAGEYDIPMSTLGNTMPSEFRATATVDRSKVNADNPTLNFAGTATFGKRDLELTIEAGAGVDLAAEIARALEAEGTIKLAKMAASLALKSAVKATLNGKAAIKGTFEIVYVKGYEVKHV